MGLGRTSLIARVKDLNFPGKALGSHSRVSIRRQTGSLVWCRTSILAQDRLERTPLETRRSLRRWL